ncbi:hypothetical protein [Rhodospirillum sp. A1_3_36]|uniref:hypothetical protein n=1 Tax=Rhodospirillum sp. A1_3_36 TaxID=3391666 RepID=UPI0039A71F56
MLAEIEGIPYGRVTIKCPRCRATLNWRAVPSPDSEPGSRSRWHSSRPSPTPGRLRGRRASRWPHWSGLRRWPERLPGRRRLLEKGSRRAVECWRRWLR